MNLPLKTRLTLWYVTLFTLIVGVWCVSVILIARVDLQAATDRALASRATQIAAGFTGDQDSEFLGVSDSTLAGVPRTEQVSQLVSATGVVLEFSGDAVAKKPMVPQSLIDEVIRTGSAKMATVVSQDERFRVLVARLPNANRFILVGTATENVDAAMKRLVIVMLLTGPLVLVAAGVGGWFLAGRALRPVSEMTATAAGIRIDRLDERVPVPLGEDELTALARTLNSMLERLEEGIGEKRRLVADASHELQTPLAVMRTELDVSLASGTLPPEATEVLESAREETDRMARIVRNLLTLARFDEGTLRLLRAPVDLHELAEETAAGLSTLARERGVSVHVTGESAVAVADAEYLRMVVTNLLENALKYSGEGASVTLETRIDGDDAILDVSDTGPGIPSEAVPHVFDRFYRVDRSRSKDGGGSGLGLAISREVVDAHGGRIELESEVGSGSRFTVHLPRRTQATRSA